MWSIENLIRCFGAKFKRSKFLALRTDSRSFQIRSKIVDVGVGVGVGSNSAPASKQRRVQLDPLDNDCKITILLKVHSDAKGARKFPDNSLNMFETSEMEDGEQCGQMVWSKL